MASTGLKRVPFQEVVNGIHDAILNPQAWQGTVRKAAAYCGSSTGVMIWMDVRNRRPLLAHSTMPLDAIKTYSTEYFLEDPCQQFYFGNVAAEASLSAHWEPRKRYLDSPLYRRLLGQVDVEDRAAVTVLRDADHFAVVGIGRGKHEPLYKPEDLERLRELAPHLRQAVRILHRLQRSQAESLALTNVLNQLDDGVFLLDGARRIVFANDAAEDLAAGGTLPIRDGRLNPALPEEADALRRLLDGAIRTSDGAGTHAGGSMALHDADGTLRAMLAVSPLRTGAISGPMGANPVRAAVFVREGSERRSGSADKLQALFKLTPAEARVAVGLAQGKQLQDIADAYGVGRETLRTQLRGVFDKTGVRRQVDLMKVLCSVPWESPPARGKLPN